MKSKDREQWHMARMQIIAIVGSRSIWYVYTSVRVYGRTTAATNLAASWNDPRPMIQRPVYASVMTEAHITRAKDPETATAM